MPIDRRTFLKLGGIGIVGVTFTPLLNGCEEHIVTPHMKPTPIPFLTPTEEFFVQNGGEGSITGWTMPDLNQDKWKLEVGRQIGQTFVPSTFPNGKAFIDFSDLMTAKENGQQITILKTMQCILESPLRITETGFTGTAYWTGIPLKYFLDQVSDILSGNRRLAFESADGFLNNIEIDRVMKSEELGLYPPLLAYRMNNETLTREHGFPVRLIVEEMYGYRNIKWITRVKATPSRNDDGTYQRNGYTEPVMNVNSRATNVREGISIPPGATQVLGFAISGHAPVSKVEIAIDGEEEGNWQETTFVPFDEIQDKEAVPPIIKQIQDNIPYPFRAVWTPWRFDWQATKGTHSIAIRATDSDGNVQPSVEDSLGNGQNAITRYHITVE